MVWQEVQCLCIEEQAPADRWEATLQDFADVELPRAGRRLDFQGLRASGESGFLLTMQLSHLQSNHSVSASGLSNSFNPCTAMCKAQQLRDLSGSTAHDKNLVNAS